MRDWLYFWIVLVLFGIGFIWRYGLWLYFKLTMSKEEFHELMKPRPPTYYK